MNSFTKDILREIKKSLGRFISIFAIVMIGVAFFSGVKASVPVMKKSADTYFDKNHLMDFRILSNLGMTQDDAQEIAKLKGVEGVYPTHTMDFTTNLKEKEYVFKVHGMPKNTNSDNYMNRLNIVEGRLPEKNGEIVIEYGKITDGKKYQLGDKIKLKTGTSDKISDVLTTDTFTIVGFIRSPYYLSYEKGSSNIGSGEVSYYSYILEENFKSEIFTEIFVTMKNVRQYNSYDEIYFKKLEPLQNELEELSTKQTQKRLETVKKEAYDKLKKGKDEFEEKKLLFETEIKAAEEKIELGKEELILGQAKIEIEENNAKNKFEQAETLLKQKEIELKEGEIAYQEGLIEYETKKEQADKYIHEYEVKKQEALTQTNARIKDLEEKLKDPQLNDVLKNYYETELATLKEILYELESNTSTFDQAIQMVKDELENGKKQLDDAKKQLEDGKVAIKQGYIDLEKGKKEAEIKFKQAREDIVKGKLELKKGEAELEKNKKFGEKELQLAQEKIEKSEKEIESLSDASWYVLDRKSHYSYRDYEGAADRMDAIAKVFPLFFFLVAALVCLTTMTRMVDEQRGIIGTYKAVGYSKVSIAMKYVVYASAASIAGSVVGNLIGMYIFPYVIFICWNIMYTIPQIAFSFEWNLFFISTVTVVCITTLSATVACYKELIETPALLMRPKAPKNGKRIFLERITFLWKKLSFTKKVTARNLFRYKKRFYMTVLGISGCTALLVAGFGIRDSISEIIDKQFKEITKFDATLQYEHDLTLKEKDKLFEMVQEDKMVKNAMDVALYSGKVKVDNESMDAKIFVPESIRDFKDFVSLHTRKSTKEISMNHHSVIISEKMAKDLGISVNDTIILDNGTDEKEVEVSAIVENYVDHYVYMSANYYKKTFEVTSEPTSMILKLKDNSETSENKFGSKYMHIDGIASVSFFTPIVNQFSGMISSLSIVVVVLVISAALLAFVVLYNLTNVNISERLREIATIKVLGFYDNEVSAYVYRENMILTLIGALVGLLLGTALQRYIMSVAELDTVMFGRNITLLSYVISFVITCLFSYLVNKVMYYKLKKIPMVESLKSVE